MLINPVNVRVSAHVAQRVLELVEKAYAKRQDDIVLATALDALKAALAERN